MGHSRKRVERRLAKISERDEAERELMAFQETLAVLQDQSGASNHSVPASVAPFVGLRIAGTVSKPRRGGTT
jgi:hypothetical protein